MSRNGYRWWTWPGYVLLCLLSLAILTSGAVMFGPIVLVVGPFMGFFLYDVCPPNLFRRLEDRKRR